MTIWKYSAMINDELGLDMPKGAKILAVQMQAGRPQIWALVDPTAKVERREFYWRGTGHDCATIVPDAYIGTIQMEGGVLVFHLFEKR